VLALSTRLILEKAEGNEGWRFRITNPGWRLWAASAGSPFRAEDDHASRAVPGHLLFATNPLMQATFPKPSIRDAAF
jgi:hypothetical protein